MSFTVDSVFSASALDGIGWRIAARDPQWISIGLRAPCEAYVMSMVTQCVEIAIPLGVVGNMAVSVDAEP